MGTVEKVVHCAVRVVEGRSKGLPFQWSRLSKLDLNKHSPVFMTCQLKWESLGLSQLPTNTKLTNSSDLIHTSSTLGRSKPIAQSCATTSGGAAPHFDSADIKQMGGGIKDWWWINPDSGEAISYCTIHTHNMQNKKRCGLRKGTMWIAFPGFIHVPFAFRSRKRMKNTPFCWTRRHQPPPAQVALG